jgi:hypothetical protein
MGIIGVSKRRVYSLSLEERRRGEVIVMRRTILSPLIIWGYYSKMIVEYASFMLYAVIDLWAVGKIELK